MNVVEKIMTLAPGIQSEMHENVIKRLAKNEGVKEKDDAKYLDMYWQPFLIGAVLGFTLDLKIKEIEGKKISPFKYSTLANNSIGSINTLIAFAVAKDGYQILLDHSAINKCIEEYANAGLEYLSELIATDLDLFNDYNGYHELITDLL